MCRCYRCYYLLSCLQDYFHDRSAERREARRRLGRFHRIDDRRAHEEVPESREGNNNDQYGGDYDISFCVLILHGL